MTTALPVRWRRFVGVFVVPLLPSASLSAQIRPDLELQWEDGTSVTVPVGTTRGYAAVDVDDLAALGWTAERQANAVTLRGPEGTVVVFRSESPFFRWNDRSFQFVDVVYEDRGRVMVPLQFLVDFLPQRLPDLYDFDPAASRLLAATRGAFRTGPDRRPTDLAPPPAPSDIPEPSRRRLVVIDAGHGGRDPGSIARSGLQEKAVALGVARSVARRLRGNPTVDVLMIRDDDTFVDVWKRGEIATTERGERPGVFVSIHANSFNTPARGFETYFLSEARTEHERRVAAIENAPVRVDDAEVSPGNDLDFILRELRNLDHSHWSNLLADMVQGELADLHPGPNRGVKQAPLAVLTNALMPSVLVEIGYLSHPDEARLLGRSDFQRRAGEAIADAVVRFFERYPPGSGSGAGEAR